MTDANIANILLAHGSRDPKWQQPFEMMLKTIRQQGQATTNNLKAEAVVELAYMELCQPSLEDTCEKLAKQGCTLIHIYPVFFSAGKHLRIDVPAQLQKIEAELNISTQLHPPIGQDSRVQTAITQVILQQL